ncbi:protein kinase domain-containing protein [Streptomyces sp.]|uniref:protein kinase domain-containing protein n=1 Tax=Streptomyces sp. TaxID=1931 RepID=UPI002D658173|nr:protein kinase [Streptomyces sp.]HZF87323.1 protein kinase [Streptomyces sp.]
MTLRKDDPRSLGGYKLIDRLGAGGMGVVYRGRARSGREVAVKVVHAQYAQDPVFRARFRQEIEAVRKVSGAFTAPVVDADAEADRPWMATQYVPGRSLAERIRAQGPLRVTELRRLALGLVEALRDIHRAGVVHRDLKPANVLMAEDGPRVIDFGISRATENLTLTETGQMIGTPPFMSPEQFTDARSVGPASDVFSLGALLAYATTGRGPFDAESPYLTAYRVINDEPLLDGVPRQLRVILERCLTKKREERPGLDELAREFATVLPEPDPVDQQTVTLRLGPPAPRADTTHSGTVTGRDTERPARRPGRLRPLPAVTGTVGALLLGLTAYLLGPGADGGASPNGTDSRWERMPAGWRPWQTSVVDTKAAVTVLGGSSVAGESRCALHRAAVYCGGDKTLPVRVDALDGRLRWRTTDLLPQGSPRDTYAAGAVLGAEDEAVIVRRSVSDDEAGDETVSLVGLDTGTGRQLWAHEVKEETMVPVVAGGLALSMDGSVLTARSPRTGAERWTVEVPAQYYCWFATEAHPYLYLECEHEEKDSFLLRLRSSDGSSHKVTPPAGSGHAGTLDGRLVFLEGVEMMTDDEQYKAVVLLDPATGARERVPLKEPLRGRVALADGTLWSATSSGIVRAVSVRTGEELWRTETTLEQPSTPLLRRADDTLFAASLSGRVAALDADSGKLLWETRPRAEQVLDDGWSRSELFLHGGAVIVATPDGTLFTIDPAHPERKPASG